MTFSDIVVCFHHQFDQPSLTFTDIVVYFHHQFDQPSLTFSDRSHYSGNRSDFYRDAFIDYFSDVALLVTPDTAFADDVIRRLAADVWRLEVRLEQVCLGESCVLRENR